MSEQEKANQMSTILLACCITVIYGMYVFGAYVVDQSQEKRDRLDSRELCMTELLVEKDYTYHKANQICSRKYGFNPENFNQYYGKNVDN